MSSLKLSRFLRWALLADAIASGATGLLLLAGGNLLQPHLGLPPVLMEGAAIVMLAWALLVAVVATRERVRRPVVSGVIALNVVWAVDSVLLLFSGWVSPTMLGLAFVVVQAVAVAALAEAQYVGLRRLQPAA